MAGALTMKMDFRRRHAYKMIQFTCECHAMPCHSICIAMQKPQAMSNAVLPQMFDCYYDNFVQFLIQCENHVLPLQMLAFYLAVTYPAEIDAHLNHPGKIFKLQTIKKMKLRLVVIVLMDGAHKNIKWNSIESIESTYR